MGKSILSLTRGGAMQLYSYNWSGNMFNISQHNYMNLDMIISYRYLASDKQEYIISLLLMLVPILFTAERIWLLKSNTFSDTTVPLFP